MEPNQVQPWAWHQAEKKSLLIDWMVKWRITDPRQFIRNNGADLRNLETRLAPVVQAAFNEEVTRRNVSSVLATDRERVMSGLRERLGDDAKTFGIETIDVRVKRVDFVADISDVIVVDPSSDFFKTMHGAPAGR